MRRLLSFLTFTIIAMSAFSGAARAADAADLPYAAELTSLTAGIDSFNSHLNDCAAVYKYIVELSLPGKNLPDHEAAMRRYEIFMAFATRDEHQVQNARAAAGDRAAELPVDLFGPDEGAPGADSAQFEPALILLNKFYDSNKESHIVALLMSEVGFHLTMDRARIERRELLKRYNELEPKLDAAIAELSKSDADRPKASLLAGGLAMMAYDLRLNSRVAEAHKKHKDLLESIGDRSAQKELYEALIYSHTAIGDVETAARLTYLLTLMLASETSALSSLMGSKGYDEQYDALAGTMGSAMEYDSSGGGSGYYEEKMYKPSEIYEPAPAPAPVNYVEIGLKIEKISSVDLEYLTTDLWNLEGLVDVAQESFEKNTATLKVTLIEKKAADLAAYINSREYSGFVVKAEATDNTNATARALALASAKFNPMNPAFEYFKMPDDASTAQQAKSLADALAAYEPGAPDGFRNISYKIFSIMAARARGGGADAANLTAADSASYPMLAGFYISQRALAAEDAGRFSDAYDMFAAAAPMFASLTQDIYFSTLPQVTGANLFSAAVSSGNMERAAAEAEKIQSMKFANDLDQAKLDISVGNYLYEKGEYAKALELFQAAGSASETFAGAEYAQALALLGVGNCRIMDGMHADAEAAFGRAAELANKAGMFLLEAQARAHLARVRLFLGNYAGAREAAEAALKLAGDFENSRLKWQSLFTLARALEGGDDLKSAMEKYLAAMSIIESSGDSAGDAESQDVYRYAVALCARLKQPEEALKIIERSNSLALREQYEKSKVNFKNPETMKAAEALKKYKSEIKGLQSEIAKQSGEAGTDAGAKKLETLKATLQETQRSYIKFVTELESNNRELALLYNIEPMDLVKVRKSLPADMAVLYCLLTSDKLYLFTARADAIGFKEIPVDSAAVERLVFSLGKSYASPVEASLIGDMDPATLTAGGTLAQKRVDAFRETAEKLYELLIKPVEADLSGATTLAIIPNGILNYTPFQALMPKEGKERFLVEKYAIFYPDSLAVFQKKPEKADVEKLNLYAFGNADETLPAAENEVKLISGTIKNSHVYLRKNALEEKAKELSEEGGIFHFATHGVLDFNDISKSHILLAKAPGGADDGKFTLEEVWGYWWGNSALVSLSACNTAVGDATVRGRVVHPASAFLNAGAPSVMATLWSVDDVATSRLMDSFYKNLRTMDKATALRTAQLELMKSPKTAHPFFWAPFTLIGDWR